MYREIEIKLQIGDRLFQIGGGTFQQKQKKCVRSRKGGLYSEMGKKKSTPSGGRPCGSTSTRVGLLGAETSKALEKHAFGRGQRGETEKQREGSGYVMTKAKKKSRNEGKVNRKLT